MLIRRQSIWQPPDAESQPNIRWASGLQWLYNGAQPFTLWGPLYGPAEIVGTPPDKVLGPSGLYLNANLFGGVKFTAPIDGLFSQLDEFTLLAWMRKGAALRTQGVIWGESALLRFTSEGSQYWAAEIGQSFAYSHNLDFNASADNAVLALTTGRDTSGGNQPLRGYVNGRFVGSNVNTNLWAVNPQQNSVFIGPTQNNGLGTVAGWPYVAAGWSRKLTDNEIAEIAENPWQLFAPRRIFFPMSAPTGIPVLSGATVFDITATTARPRVTVTF
jgi:hypothetical protein